jgi:hypothetical protein
MMAAVHAHDLQRRSPTPTSAEANPKTSQVEVSSMYVMISCENRNVPK